MSPKEMYYFTGLCLSLGDHPENAESIKSRFTSGEIIPEEFIRFYNKYLILLFAFHKFKIPTLSGYVHWLKKMRACDGKREEVYFFLDFSLFRFFSSSSVILRLWKQSEP